MVQSLPGFLNLSLNVCSPCQVLGDVYTEVLEATHPLHRGPTDHKRGVGPLLSLPEVHDRLLSFAHVQRETVVLAPWCESLHLIQVCGLVCGLKVPESGGRGTESMLLEVQCEVSTVSDDLGCHVIWWCWSTVFSEVHSQPGNLRARHAFFCWQALWRCWFHFPAGFGTCPHCQRYQKPVQWPWGYCAWLASKLAWPEPHR